MMLVEAGVFRGDNRMLEIARDLLKPDELVSFVIGLALDPGLEAALHVHGGCRRVDPSRGHQDHRSSRPKRQCGEQKPSNKPSDEAFRRRGLGARVWGFSHSSE